MEDKYDEQFQIVFKAIRKLMQPDHPKQKHSIGFAPWPKTEEVD